MKQKAFIYLKLSFFIGVPLLFMIIPTAFFEKNSFCLFKNLFGISCFGCGTTRALSCFFHFEFAKGFFYNKSIVVVFPLLVIWTSKNIFLLLKKLKKAS